MFLLCLRLFVLCAFLCCCSFSCFMVTSQMQGLTEAWPNVPFHLCMVGLHSQCVIKKMITHILSASNMFVIPNVFRTFKASHRNKHSEQTGFTRQHSTQFDKIHHASEFTRLAVCLQKSVAKQPFPFCLFLMDFCLCLKVGY